MLVANGGLSSWVCSCSSQNHTPGCQCRCGMCDDARSCPCTKERCDCLLLCNCQCRNCHTAPSKPVDMEAVFGDRHDCSSPQCGNSTRADQSRCHSCEAYRRAHRECAIPGCARFAPVGGYNGNGKYCAECCKDPLIKDLDPGCRRPCKERNCTRLAPVGCDSGKRCPTCKSKRAATIASSKRKRDAGDVGE